MENMGRVPLRYVMVLVCVCCFVLHTGQCVSCPCKDKTWCNPVEPKSQNEVTMFVVSEDNWPFYDWDKITTVVQFGAPNYNLTCYAHSKGVRVAYGANFPAGNLTVQSDRKRWIENQVKYMKANFYDGVNVDFESVINKTDEAHRDGLSALIKELALTFRATFHHPQITFDVAWSPDCIDSRCYDYPALAAYSDYIFVMAYDERSQFCPKCIAWANSALNNTIHGIERFLALGIPPSKIVLGTPWYGYSYQCLTLDQKNVCKIPEVSFRGSPCSDAAGRQISYGDIVKLLKNSTSGMMWDQTAQSPYFNFKSNGKVYQVWYDNPKSLTLKFDYAVKRKLLGVGVWNVDDLDFTRSAVAKKQRKAMWRALPYGQGTKKLNSLVHI